MSAENPPVILADVESRSRVDLKTVGGRRYWEHASSEVLCVAFCNAETGERGLWRPGLPCPLPRDYILAAHNVMGFDRFAFEKLKWSKPSHPYVDTSELARRAGLPGGLDDLGERWLGIPKDKESSRYTKALSQVKKPTKAMAKGDPYWAFVYDNWKAMTDEQRREHGYQRPITEEDMAIVGPYCVSDVDILEHGWPLLKPWRHLEPDVLIADRALNDRGVYFDVDLARALLASNEANVARVLSEVAAELWATPEEVRAQAASPSQFTALTGAENAQRKTLETIDHPLARARLALANIAPGKLESGLARVSLDSRLRDTQRYYGAHTGRWSGRGMQLQNLPRPSDEFKDWGDDEICFLADAVRDRKVIATHAEINLLLRACLTASPGNALCTYDFASVEARALAWAARDQKALEVFRSGMSPYKVMAGVIFGVDPNSIAKGTEWYTIGKIAELAAGYGMGGNKFLATALAAGSDILAMGLDSFAIIHAWRRLHAPIVKFWRQCEDAFISAVNGHEAWAGPYCFVPGSGAIAAFLPTGRPVVYNSARLGSDGSPVFWGPHGVEHTYGGKLAENLTQACCREFLAAALVRAEKRGLNPVLTVHDELVVDVPWSARKEGLDELKECMLELDDWANGFPVGAEGHIGRRYRK